MSVKFPPDMGPKPVTLDTLKLEMYYYDKLPPRIREALANSLEMPSNEQMERWLAGLEAGTRHEEGILEWLNESSRLQSLTTPLVYTPSVKRPSRKR